MINSAYLWGILVVAVLVLFLGFEIPALSKHRMWTTLSEQEWALPRPARLAISVFCILLALHFWFRTPLFLVWG